LTKPSAKDGDAAKTGGRDSSDSPSVASEQTPYERFVDFARKIIAVPKSELQEQERLYREHRQAALPSAGGKKPSSPKKFRG
jgi:hypothetical protein